MRKRSSMNKSEAVKVAASIIQAMTDGVDVRTEDGKNPFAVALGRRGGLKGGKARAAKLTSQQRSEIAQKAALSRWQRRK